MCAGAGKLGTWIKQIYRNRGGILVRSGIAAARARSEGWPYWHFSDVFEVLRCYFPRNDPAVDVWNSLIFGHSPFCENISGNRQKKVAQMQKNCETKQVQPRSRRTRCRTTGMEIVRRIL
jgi:hypothetical protein